MEKVEYHGYYVAVGVYRLLNRDVIEDFKKIINELSVGDVVLELFNSEFVISLKQILFAAISAIKAFFSETNIAKSLGIEILLRLSSETQIDKAIEKIGVNKGVDEVGVCIVSKSIDKLEETMRKLLQKIDFVELPEEYLHSTDRIRRALEFYNIRQEEIESIQARDLHEAVLLAVLEKIATVDIER